MQIFEYPYVMITIFAVFILILGLLGLLFTMKSVKTAREIPERGFCGLGKLESDYERAASGRRNRCVTYIESSFDGMRRLYSESEVHRMREQMKQILLVHFGEHKEGQISLYETDNFVAIQYMDEEAVIACVEKCAKAINGALTKYGSINVVRVHFGFYCGCATDVSFQVALGRAKQACSMAEDKECLYFRWDSMNGRAFERKIKIENSIQEEIDNNRFFLEYQPILDAKQDEVLGAEVLSRLNSSTEGVLTPRHFLSAVNEVGLTEEFDYYIFEKNCKWIANDREKRTSYFYTINFSRHTLCDLRMAEKIVGIIEKYEIDSSCIAVEILEDRSLNKEEKERLIQNLVRLREKGVLILLDDFGKGYTGFDDLMDLDINIVKIDKSIVQNATSEKGYLILKNIIKTAHDLGFRTLCEGIETEEHKMAAVDAGSDMLQGFYFYRPMLVAQFETLFEK